MTIVLGLGAALMFALSDWSGMRATRVVGPGLGLALLVAAGILPAIVGWAAFGGLPHDAAQREALGLALAGGAAYYGGQLALFRGIQDGDLAVVGPIATLEGAVAVAIAAGLGERVAGLALAGVAVAIGGAVLTAVEPGRRRARGAGCGLVAAGLFGVASVLWAHAAASGTAEVVAASKLAGLVLVAPLLLALARDRDRRPPRPPWAAVGVAAACELGALAATAAALALGPISIASTCQSQYGTCGAILGIVLVRERPARHQLAGVLVTATGVALMAWAMA